MMFYCLSVSIGNHTVLVKLNLIMSNLAVTCIYIYTVCTLLRQQKKVQNVEIIEKYGHYMEQQSLIIHNWSTLWGHLKYIKCLI